MLNSCGWATQSVHARRVLTATSDCDSVSAAEEEEDEDEDEVDAAAEHGTLLDAMASPLLLLPLLLPLLSPLPPLLLLLLLLLSSDTLSSAMEMGEVGRLCAILTSPDSAMLMLKPLEWEMLIGLTAGVLRGRPGPRRSPCSRSR